MAATKLLALVLSTVLLFALGFEGFHVTAEEGVQIPHDTHSEGTDSLSLKAELDQLKSEIHLLETRLAESDKDIKSKDETATNLEKIIQEKSNTISLLQSEIESTQTKGTSDAEERVDKAHARAAELQKQFDQLKKELETQSKEKKVLEARADEAQRKVDELKLKLNRGYRHRRAHSETFSRFSDDLSAGENPAATDTTNSISTFNNCSLDVPMAIDFLPECSRSGDKSSSAASRPPLGHLRSLSVDASFFQGISFGAQVFDGGDTGGKSALLAVPSPSGEKRAGFHRRNRSIDSSSDADSLMDGLKKSITSEKLAELALIDPKRANRILSNRLSAARSKERRTRYTSELERKVQTLQTEVTALSAQITVLQQDVTVMTAANRELKLRLQAQEQQAPLKDALNETLREEVQRLRIAAGEMPLTNRSSNPFGGQQTHLPQFGMPRPSSNNPNPVKQRQPNYLGFNQS